MKITSIIAASRFFILVLLLVVAAPQTGSGDGPSGEIDPLGRRLKVSLFRYAGSEEGEPRLHFSRFRGILRDKITVLVEELTGASSKFGYLKDLTLEPPGNDGLPDKLGSEAAVQKYWAGSRSLILLRGSIVPEKDKSYSAQTRIFLGDLRGSMPHPSLAVRLPINEEQFANTSDSHSLTIYYALAMDAARLGNEPAHVMTLLSRAQDKIRDLSRRGSLPPAVIEVQRAVERAIAIQKGRISSP
jgi:hypothetical protein